ncbi:aldo/keto reductase [Termitidicoccus mucosus]|uniref:Aldo/keto reductase n=1 Tax=Termitidicoccus mucosus TaxID=1184151 RepID=A0A178IDI7_9BACT|nr:aldo/keto reductase [Opitutaceae bacterium TSB47]
MSATADATAPQNTPSSRLIYGCMRLGARWDSSPLTDGQRHAAFAAIDAALAAGMTFFDHADIYCHGKSELVFGEYLRAHPGLRRRLTLQSKCGIRFADESGSGDPHRFDFSREHILRSVDGILERLGIGQLDILLLHRPDCLVEPEEVASAFDALHASGKVRAFGVSNHTGLQIDLLRRHVRQPIVANQLELSLAHHPLISEGILANQRGVPSQLATGMLDYCRLHDITIQAWSPVGGGRLHKPGLPADDPHRHLVDFLKNMASEKSTNMDALLLAWLLRHPAGIRPVLGTVNPERIAAAAEAERLALTRGEWYAMLEAARGEVP